MSDMDRIIRTIETNFRLGILSNKQTASDLRAEMGLLSKDFRAFAERVDERMGHMDLKVESAMKEHEKRAEETITALRSVLEIRIEEKRKIAADSKRIEEDAKRIDELESRVKALEDKQAS